MYCRPFQTGVWSKWTDRSETSQSVTARGHSDPSAARGGGGIWGEQRGAQCPQLLSDGKTSSANQILYHYLISVSLFSSDMLSVQMMKGPPSIHRPFALCDEQIFLNICTRGTLSHSPYLLPVTRELFLSLSLSLS